MYEAPYRGVLPVNQPASFASNLVGHVPLQSQAQPVAPVQTPQTQTPLPPQYYTRGMPTPQQYAAMISQATPSKPLQQTPVYRKY